MNRQDKALRENLHGLIAECRERVRRIRHLRSHWSEETVGDRPIEVMLLHATHAKVKRLLRELRTRPS
jgi:hypothetical protein